MVHEITILNSGIMIDTTIFIQGRRLVGRTMKESHADIATVQSINRSNRSLPNEQ